MSKKLVMLAIMSTILCALFTLTGGITGCGQVQKNSSGAVTNFPHTDDKRWLYKETTTLGTLETIYKTTQYFDGVATLESGLMVQRYRVSEEVVSESISAWRPINAFALPSGGFYYIDDSGVYRYYSITTSEAELELPLPLDVGKTWQRNARASFEAVAREEIIVPAGTFIAIKITSKSFSDTEHYEWYADGVGLVKSFTKTLNIPLVSTVETFVSTLELLSKNF